MINSRLTKPEVLQQTRAMADDDREASVARNLERLAWLMDRAFHIPGTRIRVGLDAIGDRAIRKRDPVAQRARRQRLHVVRNRIVAPGRDRVRLHGAVQSECGAGAGAEGEFRVLAGRPDQVQDVLGDGRVHPYRAHVLL